MKGTSHNSEIQNLNYLNYSSPENVEGGIDISEIKNIFSRNLPLILGSTIAMTSLAFLKVLTTPSDYVAGFELLSEPVNIETKVTSSNEDSRKTREQITEVELDEVQLKILKSPQLISRVIESLQKQYPEMDYQELIAGLTIDIDFSGSQEQNVLQVTYRNPDRQKVADVISELNKVYQNYSVEKRQSGVKRGIAFLDGQIPQVSEQTREIEAQIAQLRTQYNFNNPDSSLTEITSRINQLSQRREDNRIELNELRLTLRNLEAELVVKPYQSPTALDLATPRYLKLSSKMEDIEIEINQKSNIYADNSQMMQALKRDKQQLSLLIDEAGEDIRQKLNNQIKAIENRQSSIDTEVKNLGIQLEQWSRISGEYNSLQHRLNIANGKLNGFISQKDALQIDAAQQESPWQLLTPATEPQLDNISTINYLLLGSTLGLLLGSSAAFLLDKQQKIIYTSAKVGEITNLPILATIPYSPKVKLSFAKPLALTGSGRESLATTHLSDTDRVSLEFSAPSIESFRSFAVNLNLSGFSANLATDPNHKDLKSIVVTSAIPEEGRSTVALNLAKASASMGKKVLLVDTDLRSTNSLTSNLGFGLETGLIDVLTQQSSMPVLNCVQSLPLARNLYILPSGLNDSEKDNSAIDFGFLLASQRMRNLMEELESTFDLVIYDLCSIIGFADVNLLAAETDGIVVVTGLGRIQSVAFTEALNQLKLCNAPVLGIAVNKVVNKG